MMNRARADAETHRKELMDRAREEIDRIQSRWVETVNAEREAFLLELRRLAGEQIYAIARQVLKDLADRKCSPIASGPSTKRRRPSSGNP